MGSTFMAVTTHSTANRALHITPLERRALQLLADGRSSSDVAGDLGVGACEIGIMLARLFAAMGAATQPEAIRLARRRGLLAADALPASPPTQSDLVRC
jgi:DNA-binding CsgD family transcriptional regulator